MAQARFILANINWSFSSPFSVGRSGVSLFDCRKYHWYPATFIPEIPYTLVEVLARPESVVYDPFSGIGTTFFQSILLGRRAFATENCRIAVNVTRSILRLFQCSESRLQDAAEEIQHLEDGYNARKDYSKLLKDSQIRVDLLRPWFNTETFNQLMFLRLVQERTSNPATEAATRVSVSAILKAVSGQDEGWGCIADNMLPKPRQLKKDKKAFDQFRLKARMLIRDVMGALSTASPTSRAIFRNSRPESSILKCDARYCPDLLPQAVDLVVTSPPYPSMTDYATSQRLSYYWEGADPMEDLGTEIGARRRRFSNAALGEYRAGIEGVLSALGMKLRPNGYACFVMPSFSSDKTNNSARKQIIQECLASLVNNGFVLEQELSRILPRLRRHHNQSWTSLERENIFIYRRTS
jgi:DNA modification methylase